MGTLVRRARLGCIILALAGSVCIGVAFVAVSPAAADHHTWEEAPDLDEKANLTVNLPYPTDHYPGDRNEENMSAEYFGSGAEAFGALDAEDGIWINLIIIRAHWIDYSACTSGNTGAFGIDRGNNNSGTRTDESLVEHRKTDEFRKHGINIILYDWNDFAGDPPYLAPPDAIVAAEGKAAGPCMTATSDRGWYQVQGFVNGTVADGDCTEEGNSECQPEGEETEEIGVRFKSNYVYICECDSEQEAREELGPPPSEETPTPDGGDEATPTPTGTEDIDDEPTPTPTEIPPQDAGTATPTATPTRTATDERGGGDTSDSEGSDAGDSGGVGTPTISGGPGFTSIVTILALLGAALLALRRP